MSLDLTIYKKTPVTCPCCRQKFDIHDIPEFADGELSFYEVGENPSLNITHNLTDMAQAVSDEFYRAIWRPEELWVSPTTTDIRPYIVAGLIELKANPTKYRSHDAPNGWGTYDNFVPWLEKYLEFCDQYPGCSVTAWR